MQEHPDNVIPPNEIARRRRVAQLAEEIADFCKDLIDRAVEYQDLGVPARDWLPLVLDHASPDIRKFVDSGPFPMLAPVIIEAILLKRQGKDLKSLIPSLMQGVRDATADGEIEDIIETARAEDDAPPPLAALMPYLISLFASRPESALAPLRTSGADTDRCAMMNVITRHLREAPKVKEGDAPAIEATVFLRAVGRADGVLSETPEGTLRMLSPNKIGDRELLVEQFFAYSDVVSFALIRPVTSKSSLITS